jgi:hypothetical protein
MLQTVLRSLWNHNIFLELSSETKVSFRLRLLVGKPSIFRIKKFEVKLTNQSFLDYYLKKVFGISGDTGLMI